MYTRTSCPPGPLTCSSRCWLPTPPSRSISSSKPSALSPAAPPSATCARSATCAATNHNGRFYTDRDPARFDRFGLLSLGDVHFSRDGSLPATVRRLLDESEDGCTDRELRALLHVPVHPFLLAAVRQDRARRERLGGVYVYLRNGPAGDRQLQARLARLAASGEAAPDATLEPELIIAVLLVLVRYPGSRPTAVARRLQGRSPPIGRAQVQAVFDRFELAGSGQKGGSTRS